MKNLFYFLIILIITSCEGIMGGKGFVYSVKEMAPLERVKIIFFVDDEPVDTTYSDANGYFIMEKLVGCVPDCPESKLVFGKEKFKELTIEINDNFYREYNQDSLVIKMHYAN